MAEFPQTFPFYFDVRAQVVRDQWFFEARDASGDLLYRLTDLFEARLEASLLAPTRLVLRGRRDNEALGSLAGMNEVWVRKRNSAAVEAVFALGSERDSVSSAETEIVLYDPLAQLGREVIGSYASEGGDTIDDILVDWFALQDMGSALSLGSIDGTIGAETPTVEIAAPTSILAALRQLEEGLGYETRWWVDADRRFWWERLSSSIQNQVRVGGELANVEREVAHGDVVTRLYAYGSNEGGERVVLSDADGQSEDYVDADRSAWGYRKQLVIDHGQVTIASDESRVGVEDYAFAVSLSSDASLQSHAQSDGSDIAFFDSDGDKLTHELGTYDSSNGALTAWVSLGFVSGVVDTVVYMRYGGASGVGQAGSVDHDPGGKSAGWIGTWNTNAASFSEFCAVGPPVSEYGVIPGVRVRERVSDAATLLEWAEAEVERLATPWVSYRVTLPDTEAHKRFPERTYTLGRVQHLVDMAKGIDVAKAVVRLARNLLNPFETELVLGALWDRADPVVDVIERLEADDKTDFLNADDVYVTPTVTLDDWETNSGLIDSTKLYPPIEGGEGGGDLDLEVVPSQAAFGVKDADGSTYTDTNCEIASNIDGLQVSYVGATGDTSVLSLNNGGTFPVSLDDTETQVIEFAFNTTGLENDGQTYCAVFEFSTNKSPGGFSVVVSAATQNEVTGLHYSVSPTQVSFGVKDAGAGATQKQKGTITAHVDDVDVTAVSDHGDTSIITLESALPTNLAKDGTSTFTFEFNPPENNGVTYCTVFEFTMNQSPEKFSVVVTGATEYEAADADNYTDWQMNAWGNDPRAAI